MKTLSQYLFENILGIFEDNGTKTKFDKSTNNFDDLIKNNSELNANKNPEAVNKLIEDIVSLANYRPEELFIYANGASYFKIPYAFHEAIVKISHSSKYRSIFKFKEIYKNKIQVSFIKGGPVFETGYGSIGRVSTEQQETATCIVWNAYIDALRENRIFDTNDSVFIRGLVKELTDKFDSEWISTFGKQCVAITKYLESIGCDPKDYKMCRYGESASKNKVSDAYSKFISNYTKEIGGQKDNFDPSDVLIYLESASNDIISKLNKYASDPVNSKQTYLNEIFENKLLQGISLKKIVGNKDGKYSKYNTSDQNEARIGNVTNYEVNYKRSNDNQFIVYVEGNFRFDDITDSEGNDVEATNSITLTMRSFGSGTIAMDVCINEKKSPSLGKCPIRIWRETFGMDPRKTESLTKCISAMREFMENNNEEFIKGQLKHLIASAVKEGPACFPFILLH